MRISEVSEKAGVSIDTLRYYERIGLLPPVKRAGNGIREYSELDLKGVEFVKCMRNAGLPIDVLIEYISLVQQGDQTILPRQEILKEQRKLLAARMIEIQETLDLLDYKIEIYKHAFLEKEKVLVDAEE